jgi:uncharacterized protein YjbJ (UPF0337 family)
MLNEQQFEGKWKEIKGGIQNLWGRITDDELEQIKGNITEVSGLVEEKYGETKDEIKQKLTHLMESFDNDTDKNISPDVSSYERSPVETRTAETSQKQDSDIKTRTPERKKFDEKTYEASQEGESNYSGSNPGRSGFGVNSNEGNSTLKDFDSDRNARH